MGSFDDFASALQEGVKDLAKQIFDGFEDEALDDAKAFLEKTTDDLQRWSRLLAQGDLTEQDFSDLVNAKRALAEIHALKQKGVAMAKLERFRSGLVALVIDTAIDVFV